eukprot:scaffold72127_cov19-Tisochrysis_lutea.AAC.5
MAWHSQSEDESVADYRVTHAKEVSQEKAWHVQCEETKGWHGILIVDRWGILNMVMTAGKSLQTTLTESNANAKRHTGYILSPASAPPLPCPPSAAAAALLLLRQPAGPQPPLGVRPGRGRCYTTRAARPSPRPHRRPPSTSAAIAALGGSVRAAWEGDGGRLEPQQGLPEGPQVPQTLYDDIEEAVVLALAIAQAAHQLQAAGGRALATLVQHDAGLGQPQGSSTDLR